VDPGPEFVGHIMSVEHEPITGVGGRAASGVQRQTLKLNALFALPEELANLS